MTADRTQSTRDDTSAFTPASPTLDAADLPEDIHVTGLGLSLRPANALRNGGYELVAQVTARTRRELRNLRNMGDKSLDEIEGRLSDLGLALREETEVQAPLSRGIAAGHTALDLVRARAANRERITEDSEISSLGLSTRPASSLQAKRDRNAKPIEFVWDLVDHTRQELRTRRDMGIKSLDEIEERLADFGLALRQPGGPLRDPLNAPVSRLQIPWKAKFELGHIGVTMVNQLPTVSEARLLKLHKVDAEMVQLIRDQLAVNGLWLFGEEPRPLSRAELIEQSLDAMAMDASQRKGLKVLVELLVEQALDARGAL